MKKWIVQINLFLNILFCINNFFEYKKGSKYHDK